MGDFDPMLEIDTRNTDTISPPVQSKEVKISLSPIMEAAKPIVCSTASRQEIAGLFGLQTQAIRILAGGCASFHQNGVWFWRSPGFRNTDNHNLASGANYRVLAGAIAAEALGVSVVVGSRYPDDHYPAPNDVMREELKEMGVSEEQIIEDPHTLDTTAEVIRLLELSEEYGWNYVSIVTNSYHVDRVHAVVANLDWLILPDERTHFLKSALRKLQDKKLTVRVVSADETIRLYSESLYQKFLKPDQEASDLGTRIVNEQRGVRDLAGGSYTRLGRRLHKT